MGSSKSTRAIQLLFIGSKRSPEALYASPLLSSHSCNRVALRQRADWDDRRQSSGLVPLRLSTALCDFRRVEGVEHAEGRDVRWRELEGHCRAVAERTGNADCKYFDQIQIGQWEIVSRQCAIRRQWLFHTLLAMGPQN